MSKDSKAKAAKGFLQFRVSRDEQRGAELIKKVEKIASINGLSMNDVANMAIAAGLPMVEQKLGEIHEPAKAA